MKSVESVIFFTVLTAIIIALGCYLIGLELSHLIHGY